ncbi:MAG: MBL fold metallo-hydrolase [Spirochaetota bacterium]
MIQQVAPTIKIVYTEDGFTESNCVLVEDDTRLMIDSGAGRALAEARPDTVDVLVNSHHHVDHIRGNDDFTRARILAHRLEKDAMGSPEKLMAVSGWDELMEGSLEEHASQFGGIPARLYEPWRVDETIVEGQVIDCGRTRFEVLHTPGHTAGHCSFFFPEESLVFMGDICLTAAGPWYGEENADIDEFIGSIDRIIELNPARIVTGHRPGVIESDIPRVLTEYRDRMLKREQRIFNYLKEHPLDHPRAGGAEPDLPGASDHFRSLLGKIHA